MRDRHLKFHEDRDNLLNDVALGDSAGGTTPYVVTWLTAETGNNVAPAYYVVAAAIVSLSTILTIRETAGRSLPQGVADEMFQSNADVRGAATPG